MLLWSQTDKDFPWQDFSSAGLSGFFLVLSCSFLGKFHFWVVSKRASVFSWRCLQFWENKFVVGGEKKSKNKARKLWCSEENKVEVQEKLPTALPLSYRWGKCPDWGQRRRRYKPGHSHCLFICVIYPEIFSNQFDLIIIEQNLLHSEKAPDLIVLQNCSFVGTCTCWIENTNRVVTTQPASEATTNLARGAMLFVTSQRVV